MTDSSERQELNRHAATRSRSGSDADDRSGAIIDTSTPRKGSDCDSPLIGSSETYRLIPGGGHDDGTDPEEHTNLAMTAFNVTNSIVGSSILGVPYAFRQSGLVFGSILIVFVALVTDYSLNLLVLGGTLTNAKSYQELVKVAMGRRGYFLISLMQALYPFVAMVSCNVIIADTVTTLLSRLGIVWFQDGHHTFSARALIISLSTLIVMLPLSLYKNVGKLAKMSLISLVIMLFLMAVLIGKSSQYYSIIPSSSDWTASDFVYPNIPQAIGIFAYAFMCQHNTHMNYYALKERSFAKWTTVVHFSTAAALAINAAVGYACYLTFKRLTQGDLFENYCEHDDLVNAARAVFALSIMITYPMECLVVRQVIEHFVDKESAGKSSLVRHVLHTVCICVAATLVSLSTSCLGVVLEINGVLTAAPLAFIFPPLCILRLQQEPVWRWKNAFLLALIVFGVLVVAFGVAVIAIDMASGIHCNAGNEPFYCAYMYQEMVPVRNVTLESA